METPPSGYPYGFGQQPEPQQDGPLQRFNFPSTPSHYRQPQGYPQQQQPQPQQQQGPPSGYNPSYEPQRPPRNQPAQSQRRRTAPEPPVGGAHNPLVRPYAMTGGRTRPRYQLAIEALVHTTADPSRLQGQLPEHQRICQLCREIKSVAEISALLTIPLGVARILVADLAEAGLVAIHQPGGDETAGGQPDVTLLERVLSGLRKL
ncbi:DUF742 domain-containing protein [Streptomyces sp. SAJ15]|uniref:DUF742 domain-containing protein n=1 Tax=Streptomyces sp. SAJ15 TaxID=2011095 RepID=UPI0011872B8A|nr:DUF742 domain-containing protein [Streptomyces sp. SAJ15]TVL94300.1 hypothetical protein CD790_04810 [Streptomyces sp. SAJ15]